MEIQSLVKSGKMQRIKSTAVLQNARSSMVALAARPLDRKVSINTGAWHQTQAVLAAALAAAPSHFTCDTHLPNPRTWSDRSIHTSATVWRCITV